MNNALIISGGTGTRMRGDLSKQYLEVAGKLIFAYCTGSLLEHDRIDAIQVVAVPLWQEKILRWNKRRTSCLIEGSSLWEKNFKGFSDPGESRQLSIYHGLEDIGGCADDADYVFIHDVARPLLSADMITECLDGALEHAGFANEGYGLL